jgi:hypothetical protein
MELEKMRLAMGIVNSSSAPPDLDFVKHIFHQMFFREKLCACDFVCNNWIAHLTKLMGNLKNIQPVF